MSFGRRRPGEGPRGTARDAALGLLSRRSHTEAELRRKLRLRAFEPPAIDEAISFLREKGFVDDAAAAEAVVRSKSRRSGRTVIRQTLTARGVSKENAERAMETLSPEVERKALADALSKKDRSLASGLTSRERSKKLFDHLARRGFPPDAIREALHEKGNPPHDADD
ncbi:MAG: regulatory protein RecX [Acidobacteria bacterium]|nr:regulatory protein RecX [Acidobacteriota bacterium]